MSIRFNKITVILIVQTHLRLMLRIFLETLSTKTKNKPTVLRSNILLSILQ